MDRHRLWRRVVSDYERLKKLAPTGFEPIVEVYLAGRQSPIELGFVRTRRGGDDPWIRFEALNRAAGDHLDGKAHPEDYWVHVHESYVQHVEIRLRRTASAESVDLGVKIGFAYEEVDDQTDPGSDAA